MDETEQTKGNSVQSLPDINILKIALEFAVIIGVPLIALLGLGIYLDKTNGTTPTFIFIGMGLAMIISTYGLYKKISKILSELNGKYKK